MITHRGVIGNAILLGVGLGSGVGAGWDNKKSPVSTVHAPVRIESAPRVCDSPWFHIGETLETKDLQGLGEVSFGLDSVHVRNVVLKPKGDVEVAYQLEMRMRPDLSRALVAESKMLCLKEEKPSALGLSLARMTLPVLGDLHFPSGQITVFNRPEGTRSDLYNHARIWEMNVSAGDYFSFSPNWSAYSRTKTLSQYLDLLKSRLLLSKIELRALGGERMGIYGEKSIGRDRSEFLIVLARSRG